MTQFNDEFIYQLIDENFPYEKYNEGQRNAIFTAVKAFLSGKRHVIMESPTGTGKSIIAITLAKVLNHLNHAVCGTIITVTKGLQDQILNDGFVNADLRSATNYKCPYGKGSYGTAGCKSFNKENGCYSTCPYIVAKDEFTNSELRSINTAMLVNISPITVGETDQSLLVLDECHKVPDVLVNQATLEWSVESLQDLKEYGEKFKHDSIENVYKKIINTINRYDESTVFNFDDYDELVSQIDMINNFSTKLVEKLDEKMKETTDETSMSSLLKISNVFRNIQKTNSIIASGARHFVVCETGKDKAVLTPVFSQDVVDSFVYSKGAIYLHMSATICGHEEYAEQMNISAEDYTYINVDNPIPLENRQVYYYPKIKMSGSMDDRKAKLASEHIDSIIKKYHEGENGIIHTVSFGLANKIKEFSKYSDRMYVIAGKEREKIINLLNQNEKGYIILSPSVEEGFDFKGDMARWQVVAKVPYAFMGDPVIKLTNEHFPKMYFRNAVLRVVQAAGRSTRGVTDYSDVYVIDESFLSLFNNNRALFPSYFIESVSEIEQ